MNKNKDLYISFIKIIVLRNDENFKCMKNNSNLSTLIDIILQVILGYFKSLTILRLHGIAIFLIII